MSAHPGGRRVAGWALLTAALVFLFLALRRNWTELQAYDWHVDPLRAAGSVAALAGVLAWGVWVWSRVLRRFPDGHVAPGALQRIWFLSNLARYIPGKIWQFVGVAQMARGVGIPALVLVTSMLVHVLFSILSAGAVSAAAYPYAQLGLDAFRWIAPAAALAAVVAMVHPRVLNTGLGVARRLSRREVLRWEGRWSDGVGLLLLSLVSWLLYGGAFFLFVSALVPLGPDAFPAMVAVNALAFLAGYFSLLPAGLGVREAAIALLLAPFVPPGVAPVLAILSRLWLIAAELVGAAAVLAATRRPPAA